MSSEETGAEAIELLDLGDACVETRQYFPAASFPDNVYGMGPWH